MNGGLAAEKTPRGWKQTDALWGRCMAESGRVARRAGCAVP